MEAGKITGQIKIFGYALSSIVLLGGSFYAGQRLRIASIQRPLHQSRLAQSVAFRDGAFAVSQRTGISPNSLFPAAIADSSDGSVTGNNSSSSQVEDFLNSDSPAATFQQVYMLLKEQYVDRIDSDVPLAHGAVSYLINALDDPNSRFLDKPERDAVEAESAGAFQGIAATVVVRKVQRADGILDHQLTIVDPLPGSSAEKAGLRTGDIITSINGHWVLSYDPFAEKASDLKKLEDDPYNFNKAVDALEKQETQGYGLDKAQAALDVTASAPLDLIIHRLGVAAPITVSIDPSQVTQVQSVESHRLANGTGYIGINVFTDTTASDFRAAINQLNGVKGLIIDLRDCSGGMLTPGIEIAKAFDPTVSFGSIYLRAALHGNKALVNGIPTDIKPLKTTAADISEPFKFNGPISILVNSGTANTAEMLAAFLHDRLGASVIGSSTFGDASVQTLFPLSDGSAFALTTGIMHTDTNIAFDSKGLVPEYALTDAGHAGDPDTDACIAKAEAVLATGSSNKSALRPLAANTILKNADEANPVSSRFALALRPQSKNEQDK